MSQPNHEEWSNENILKFIDLLAAEPVIWNPKHKQHMLKHKVHDAWVRIGEVMKIDLEDLKAKKKSLMATFRTLVNRKKASLRSGCSAEEVYQPIWFAYDAMELFLGSIYDVKKTINTEDDPENENTQNKNNQNENTTNKNTTNENIQNENSRNEDTLNENIRSKNASTRVQKRLRQNFDVDDAQRKLNNSFQTLNNILSDKKQEEDDCDMYAKLLATKLRKFPDKIRQRIMYKIDGLLLDYTDSYQQPLSSSPYSFCSTSSPAYIIPGSPAYTIPPSPVTVPPSSITIRIPEDSASWQNSESLLSANRITGTSEPHNRINILSEQVVRPGNNIIRTAFLNAE